jgi:thioesterase domain-containing protein
VYQTGALDALPVSIEDLARRYIREIQSVQSIGPYYFFGFSAGGTVAYEMARQLQLGGFKVAHVFLAEPMLSPRSTLKVAQDSIEGMKKFGSIRTSIWQLGKLLAKVIKRRPRAAYYRARTLWHKITGTMPPPKIRWFNYLAHIRPAVYKYHYHEVGFRLELFYRPLNEQTVAGLKLLWTHLGADGTVVHTIEGASRHLDLMSEAALAEMARVIDRAYK